MQKLLNFTKKWLSFIILRTANREIKLAYRSLENVAVKLAKMGEHLAFNETCKINSLLPTYTNIYIYIYIRIGRQQFISQARFIE